MSYFPNTSLLYADPSLLAINKPAGMLSLPNGYNPSLPHLQSILEPFYGRLWIVHRLDRDTSGVVVLARSADAHRHLNTQFQEHRVSKLYHAFVAGQPPWENLTIADPLRPDGDRRHRTVVDPTRGKPAITELRVLHRFAGYSLLEVAPQTGRPHQIRAHLKHAGCPILADSLYGDPSHPCHKLLPRLGLHALSITLIHPETTQVVRFEAPYPPDFAGLIQVSSNK